MNIRDTIIAAIKGIRASNYPYLRQRIGLSLNEHLWSSIIQVEMNNLFSIDEDFIALREFTLVDGPKKPFDIGIIQGDKVRALIEVKILGKASKKILTKMDDFPNEIMTSPDMPARYALVLHAFPFFAENLELLPANHLFRTGISAKKKRKMDLVKLPNDTAMEIPRYVFDLFDGSRSKKPGSEIHTLDFTAHKFGIIDQGIETGITCCIAERI